MNIVWLKRDLRLNDHKPLFEAELSKDKYIIIYLFEPSLIKYPDTSLRHLQFIYHSIKDMNHTLKKFNRKVDIIEQEAVTFFKDLLSRYDIKNVYSYQESGIQKTYDRDSYR